MALLREGDVMNLRYILYQIYGKKKKINTTMPPVSLRNPGR